MEKNAGTRKKRQENKRRPIKKVTKTAWDEIRGGDAKSEKIKVSLKDLKVGSRQNFHAKLASVPRFSRLRFHLREVVRRSTYTRN